MEPLSSCLEKSIEWKQETHLFVCRLDPIAVAFRSTSCLLVEAEHQS
jgi:hypothetical protein